MDQNEKQFKDNFDKYIEKYSNRNQYSVSKIPVHAHTGTDSPRINLKDIIGAGVLYAGSSSSLPIGWSISTIGTGHYTITHNFNSTSYVVVVTPEYGGTAIAATVSVAANSFDVYTFTVTGGSPGSANSSFYFNLTKI